MNRDEFREAFDRHKDAVYKFAWRMTNSPEAAEDVAQEVFLALLRRPDAFDPTRGELRGFLFGAARNQVRKRWRESNRWAELDEDAFAAPPVAELETHEAVEAAIRAHSAFAARGVGALGIRRAELGRDCSDGGRRGGHGEVAAV
jgi:RNA polymerase sigma factor (sigma-70 family)